MQNASGSAKVVSNDSASVVVHWGSASLQTGGIVARILEIDIAAAGDSAGAYRVAIIESPAGEASATIQLDCASFIDQLGDLQNVVLASAVSSRRLIGPSEARVRHIGERLFSAVFSSQELSHIYRMSSALADQRGDSLRIVLRLGSAELAALPWESMFDTSGNSYICRREPLVRYLPIAHPAQPLTVEPPLRVLLLVSSPKELAKLDVAKEKQDIETALANLVSQGLVELEWLEHATWPSLQDALLSKQWHAVHFIGHGDFDVNSDEGLLALETPNGRLHRVNAERFVDLLREAQPMPRLVVLNACESSFSSATDMFSGTAATLVRGGVGAVAAMQFAISDAAAVAFCRGFYTAIGHGRPVDEAVRSGRVGILGLSGNSLEWITPTLYLRGRDSRLFKLSASDADQPAADRARQQIEKAAAAVAEGDIASAVPIYDALLAHRPNDRALQAAREDAATRTGSKPSSLETAKSSVYDDPDYGPALTAFYTQRWDEAVKLLRPLHARYPSDSQLHIRFEEAQRQARILVLSEQAANASDRKQWPEAIQVLQEIVRVDPGAADAQGRLQHAQQQQEIAEMISDVKRLHSSGEWAAVVGAGERLAGRQPELGDPEGLVSDARSRLQDLDRANRYADGLRSLDQEQWEEARRVFESLAQEDPGYREAIQLSRIATSHIQVGARTLPADALRPQDVVDKRFQATKFREGYDQDEVDDFLDEVAEELRRRWAVLEGEASASEQWSGLSPSDVVNKRFQATKFREGYDQDEVDNFLDQAVETLRSFADIGIGSGV